MLPETIDTTRYRGYLPPLAPAEKARLRASLLAEGCRDHLVVGSLPPGELYLIDGFNRLDIATESTIITLAYDTIDFASEDALLLWIESNSRSRRSETATTRKYFIGCRYLRERQPVGGQKRGGKSVPSDSTASLIAAEERCSDRHVKNCGKLAEHIASACSYGLDFLRPLLLTEEVKYSRKLVSELIDRGAGGCQAQVERAVHEAEGKPVTWAMLKKYLGVVEARKAKDPVEAVQKLGAELLAQAEGAEPEEIVRVIAAINDQSGQLETILAARECLRREELNHETHELHESKTEESIG